MIGRICQSGPVWRRHVFGLRRHKIRGWIRGNHLEKSQEIRRREPARGVPDSIFDV